MESKRPKISSDIDEIFFDIDWAAATTVALPELVLKSVKQTQEEPVLNPLDIPRWTSQMSMDGDLF